MKIPSWAQNGIMSPEMRLSVVRAMKGDNWEVEGEDRVIHCECGNEKVRLFFKVGIFKKRLSFSGMQGIIYGGFIVKHK